MRTPSHPTPRPSDTGGIVGSLLLAVLILAVVAAGAFFYFGGKAKVEIKKPNVTVTSNETPR